MFGDVAIVRAPFLSSKTVEFKWVISLGKPIFNLMPCTNSHVGSNTLITWLRAIYSDSVVDNAIFTCSLDTQVIGHPPKVRKNAVLNFMQTESWSSPTPQGPRSSAAKALCLRHIPKPCIWFQPSTGKFS